MEWNTHSHLRCDPLSVEPTNCHWKYNGEEKGGTNANSLCPLHEISKNYYHNYYISCLMMKESIHVRISSM